MIFKHWSKNIKLLPVILTLALLGTTAYLARINYIQQPEPVFCTQEARLCPDGSYVGRTGPKCEFSACPENISLPVGYTLDAYSVEKTLETACTKNSDCVTPDEYQLIQRCPLVTICIENKCNVVCPANVSFPWDQAETMINDCEIEKLSQKQNRLVTIFLKDGRQFQSIEPQIDRVINLANSLESKCGKIQVITE